MGIAELEELQAFFRERMVTEDAYASRLAELSQGRSRSIDGSNSLISQIYGTMKDETANISLAHKRMADSLTTTLKNLTRFTEEHKRLSSIQRDTIDTTSRKLEKHRNEVDVAKKEAASKWKIALDEEVKFDLELAEGGGDKGGGVLMTMDVMMSFADQALTVHEFNSLISKMEQDLPTQDVKYLLGTHKDCISSDDMIKFLTTRLSIDESKAIHFGNELVNQGFLKPISGGVSGININAMTGMSSMGMSSGGHKPFASGQFYQWKRLSFDNEPAHKRTRREAERAEFEYKKLVKVAEATRQSLEAQCVEYMKSIETTQRDRLATARKALDDYIQSERGHVPTTINACDRIGVFLETLSADREVQVMAERDRTGNARLLPLIYVPQIPLGIAGGISSSVDSASGSAGTNGNNGAGSAAAGKRRSLGEDSRVSPSGSGSGGGRTGKDQKRMLYSAASQQVFGVSLEESAAFKGRRVPDLLRKCLRAISKSMGGVKGSGDERNAVEVDFWLEANMNLTAVQALRTEINADSKSLKVSVLQKFPTSIIIGLTKLWLIQLPISLCSHEIYEPLKLLYLSKSDEFAGMRLGSLKSLLATLSTPHYHSLVALVGHMHKITASLDRDSAKLAELAQLMGPMILRPRIESQMTAHDKHPVRLFRDLLVHYKDIFSSAAGGVAHSPLPSSSRANSLTIEGEDIDPDDADDDDDEDGFISHEVDLILKSAEVAAGASAQNAVSRNELATATEIGSKSGGLMREVDEILAAVDKPM
ncbi:hypothetical protein HDU76_010194 [Blyttiomyces sp. JEL0837]|nr:hypothetical protein HDU76_010194 [Blyttiomyces sp. JEL0837]